MNYNVQQMNAIRRHTPRNSFYMETRRFDDGTACYEIFRQIEADRKNDRDELVIRFDDHEAAIREVRRLNGLPPVTVPQRQPIEAEQFELF